MRVPASEGSVRWLVVVVVMALFSCNLHHCREVTACAHRLTLFTPLYSFLRTVAVSLAAAASATTSSFDYSDSHTHTVQCPTLSLRLSQSETELYCAGCSISVVAAAIASSVANELSRPNTAVTSTTGVPSWTILSAVFARRLLTVLAQCCSHSEVVCA